MGFKFKQIMIVLNLRELITYLIMEMENELGDEKLLEYQIGKISKLKVGTPDLSKNSY